MNPEQELISILLSRPQARFTTNVNADWFLDVNLRWSFEAIMSLDINDVSTLNVYGRVMKSHPDSSLKLSNLNAFKRQFITAANVGVIAKQMHRRHLNYEFGKQIEQYRDAPTDDNRQTLRETLDLIDKIQTVADDGSLDGTFSALEDAMEHERPTGIKSLKSLDSMLGGGMYGGMLLTIGARPAVGKTAFAVNLAYDITNIDPNVQVDFFTLEMNKREMGNRLISVDTGINSYKMRNPYAMPSNVQMRIKQSISDYKDRKIRVYDKAPNLSDIIATIRRNASKSEPQQYVAIVDYIGLVNVPGISERYLQVGEITRQLKIAANEYDIPIIALSQLSRAIEQRMDKRPMLSDLRESGSVEQDSNVVAFLYKPNEEEAPQIERLAVEKNREGRTGDVYLNFIAGEMKFMEIPKQEGVVYD